VDKKVRLTFGIHNHQPVGNFGHVMVESFEKCYEPFLDTLAKHPTIKASLHHSGCLLEWIEAERPGYITKLAKLVEIGQVEILGGGFYEPILTAVPPEDAIEQLDLMSQWAKNRLGATVRGIWLTERIWEPSLPSLLRAAGMEFSIVDDSHFRYAGIPKEKIAGYWITERHGDTTAVFPIDRVLRYKIPFDQPDKIAAYLRTMIGRFTAPVATYADDGEKFGVWPETHEWVFGKQWLERFFTVIEAAPDIETVHFRDVLDNDPPSGRMYLPTASYHEMTEWSLPVDAGIELANITEQAKRDGSWERIAPFVRGGFWDNFLAKYPEANRLHKRMIRASRKTKAALAKSDTERTRQARTHALRSQCNCAYWHGLFGGLYLNYLRDGVGREMYRAERIADEVLGLPTIEVTDHDCDGNNEVVIDTEHISLVISAAAGGSVYELVDRRTGHQLTDVLARRREIYHDKVTQTNNQAVDPKSIHDIVRVKEEGLAELLRYDWYPRYSALDHFLAPWSDAETFATSRYGELGDFVNQPFTIERAERVGDSFLVDLVREGGLYTNGHVHPLTVRKKFRVALDKPEFCVCTDITNGGEDIDVFLVRQWNLTLLAGDAEDRWLELAGKKLMMNANGAAEDVKRFAIVDAWQNLRAEFVRADAGELWHFPIETVSQSEGGFERTYQGTAFALVDRLSLTAGETRGLPMTVTLGEVEKP
jgi:4-alpha-glucanotransferase